MAREFTVKARIVAEDDASKTVDAVQGRFSRLTNFLRSSTVVTFGDLARAFQTGAHFLGSFIEAASEAEDTAARLKTALGDIGPATARVNRELVEQATALQKTSRFSDEQVLSAQALLLNLGATAEQVPKATAAAVELAAAFKIDLNQAATLLGRTLQGIATRDLVTLLPALKDLGADSLKAGEGVDLILSRFSGAAAADLETFSGQVVSLGKAFDEFKEKIGGSVTESEDARAALGALVELLNDPQIAGGVVAMATGLKDFFGVLIGAGEKLGSSVTIVGDFLRGFSQFFPGLGQVSNDAKEGVANLNEGIGFLNSITDKVFSPVADWFKGVTAGGEMMRTLADNTAASATAAGDYGTNVNAAIVPTQTLTGATKASAAALKDEGDRLDRNIALLIRYARAKAGASSLGPVSVQGSATRSGQVFNK